MRSVTILLVFLTCAKSWGANFGVEGGQSVANAKETLDAIYEKNQPTLEVILSYAMFTSKISSIEDVNPFGHIAFALQTPEGYQVITVNQKAVPGQDKLFLRLNPIDYFYGVTPIPNAIHGSHTGLAYARSSIGIQFSHVDKKMLTDLLQKIDMLDSQHLKGEVKFCVKTNNCAKLTSEILEETGVVSKGKSQTFPFAVFDDVASFARRNSKHLNPQIVFYKKIASDHRYAFENIPVPAHRVFPTIANMLGFHSFLRLDLETTVLSAGADRTLKVELVDHLMPLADSCSRMWIGPFVQAMLKKG